MEHMEELFPFLWLLNSQTNSLLEPNELTRQLLEAAPGVRDKLSGLEQEEKEYVNHETAAALSYLRETRGLLEQLEAALKQLGGDGRGE